MVLFLALWFTRLVVNLNLVSGSTDCRKKMCHRPTQTRVRQVAMPLCKPCLASLRWGHDQLCFASMANMIFASRHWHLQTRPAQRRSHRQEDSKIPRFLYRLWCVKLGGKRLYASWWSGISIPVILQVLKSVLWLFFTKVTLTYSGRMGLSNTRHGATWLSGNRAACSFRLAVCG